MALGLVFFCRGESVLTQSPQQQHARATERQVCFETAVVGRVTEMTAWTIERSIVSYHVIIEGVLTTYDSFPGQYRSRGMHAKPATKKNVTVICSGVAARGIITETTFLHPNGNTLDHHGTKPTIQPALTASTVPHPID